jgi:hypothetical protein
MSARALKLVIDRSQMQRTRQPGRTARATATRALRSTRSRVVRRSPRCVIALYDCMCDDCVLTFQIIAPRRRKAAEAAPASDVAATSTTAPTATTTQVAPNATIQQQQQHSNSATSTSMTEVAAGASENDLVHDAHRDVRRHCGCGVS